ncbi:hypothetical protein POVCU2_0075100 [Plasmodium ovale curtisi]|uniref:UBX domain-containing protein n=1 Tax=Plasmodium ovale curtisi TaxID=864141 RepID=A0A1A8WI39_PLAOA|nr:hypothetical protein POVCU2_0075100 [Plasmodium ovale curtisi]SBS99791.1 hypothetical protein POVCU1_055070 [Plasmodium ovale curtisi]
MQQTDEMENNVKLFMEVTKSTNEKEAKDILEICQGNLEEAISTYLSKVDFERMDEIPDSGSIPGVRRRIPEKGKCKENICERKEEKIEKTNFVYILNHIGKIICPLFKNIYNIVSTCFKLVSTYIVNPSNDNNFTTYYENNFGKIHTKFFEGSLNEAIYQSNKEEKLLLVYLHIENKDSLHFCNNIFNNNEIKSFFDENCILYAQNISKGDIKEFKNIMNMYILPQINILLTSHIKNIKELSIIYGTPTVSHIINTITHYIELIQIKKENLINLDNNILNNSEIFYYNDSRKIREEQDREYQEALKNDMLKEEEKKKKENKKLLKIQYKQEIKKKRKEKRNKFPLCINENENITKICLRLPNGIKIQNNFSINHTIEDIYDWAECCEYMGDNNITIPYKFELICGHTKSVLYNTKRKIKDFDLYPNAVLNMKSLDSSDEE